MCRIRKTRGFAIVEFVLVLPLFLAFIMTIFDFGRIFYQYTILNEACRSAAREVSVMRYDSETMITTLKSRVVEMYTDLSLYDTPLETTDVDVVVPNFEDLREQPIEVSATIRCATLVGELLPGVSDTVPVTASTLSYYEWYESTAT
jgi:hypothetical protein